MMNNIIKENGKNRQLRIKYKTSLKILLKTYEFRKC